MKLKVERVDGREYLYTTDQAKGAIANGKRVRKTKVEAGDAHPVGAMATVIGSVGPDPSGIYGYWVRWDDRPEIAVFVADWKIREAR